MGSRTIQAFMNVFGLSEEQDLDTVEDPARARADEMDRNRLRSALVVHKDIKLPFPASSHSSACSPRYTNLEIAAFESKIWQFLKLIPSASQEHAKYFLAMAEGDLGKALTAVAE